MPKLRIKSGKFSSDPRDRILEVRPWELSTGPRTERGKAMTALNPVKTSDSKLFHVLKSWEAVDFWSECVRLDRLLAELEALKAQQIHSSGVLLRFDLMVSKEIHSDKFGHRWGIYEAKLSRICFKADWASSGNVPRQEYEELQALALERSHSIKADFKRIAVQFAQGVCGDSR